MRRLSGHLPSGSGDSAHLAGDPGSDVVEARASGKLLPQVEEGEHLGGNIHVYVQQTEQTMFFSLIKQTYFKSAELLPLQFMVKTKNLPFCLQGSDTGCALPCRL